MSSITDLRIRRDREQRRALQNAMVPGFAEGLQKTEAQRKATASTTPTGS